ncbi:neprilysin-2-like [Zophobas morio]|uniref:neprilysin-2-like n=1 Tax=Zophobas morio TaxID=2755281 RepID=UPI003083197B
MRRHAVSHKSKLFSLKEWLKVILCLVVLGLVCAGLSRSFKSYSSTDYTNSAILKTIDTSVNPCDDFYKFVCGNYAKNNNQPVAKRFSKIHEKARLQLKNLVKEPPHLDDGKPFKLLKIVYQSCMNPDVEETSLLFIKRLFAKLGGWPLIEPTWSEEKFDWVQLWQNFRTIGWTFDIFFSMQVYSDRSNHSERMLTITQPDLINYEILAKGVDHSHSQAYLDYIVKIVSLFGTPTTSTNPEISEILDFERNLSNILLPFELTLSPNYNPMTIQELGVTIRTIPWLELIQNFVDPVVMSNSTVINVPWLKFLKNVALLLRSTKKRTLANYMFWCAVQKSILQLPKEFREQTLEFHRVSKNKTSVEVRWRHCIEVLDKLHVAASTVYVRNIFSLKDKETVTTIALDIKKTFYSVVQNSNWMDPETKAYALLKIEKMGFVIGFPDEILDEETIETYFRGLELDSQTNYLEVYLTLTLFEHHKYVENLKQENKKSLRENWVLRANSYKPKGLYDQSTNIVEITAALMQEHYFDASRPEFVNFVTLGEVIGHEITHSLDKESRKYDEKGHLNMRWKPQSLLLFKEKAACLIKLYENMTVPEVGLKVNGTNTLNENIADNSGLKVLYETYVKWLEENRFEPELLTFPYTPRQMFWILAASDGCGNNKKNLEEYEDSAVHAPEYFRVLVPLMNSEDFGRDFNCTVGSFMNPVNKCEIW